MESLHSAENRILILYALAKAGYSMTKHDLSLIMMENLLMTYYNFSDAVYGLKDGRFILNDRKGNDEFIEITDSGKKMLELFLPNQDKHKLSMIDSYMTDFKNDLITKNTVLGSYTARDIGKYTVDLRLREGRSDIFDISLEVSTEEDAEDIVKNWKASPQKIYGEIIRLLTKKDQK